MRTAHSNWQTLVGGILVFAAACAQASSTNYGNFAGTTVTYLSVTEASGTDPIPLYGAPTVSGNTLDFNPVGFNASASNGSVDQTDGTLTMGIVSLAGNGMSGIAFSERGDYSLVGLGTAATFVDVTATFFVDIYEVDNVAINPLQITTSMTFLPNANGTFSLSPPLTQGSWSGSVLVDLNNALVQAGQPFSLGATRVSVTLDNTLVATSEVGTTSLIAKKDFKGFSMTVVPEPSITALTVAGLTGLGALRLRKLKDQQR